MKKTEYFFLMGLSWAKRTDLRPTLLHSCFAALFAISTASIAAAQLTFNVPDDLDAWITADPGTEIDFPALPPGFFGTRLGQPSDALPAMPGFELKGFPCPNLGCDLSGLHTIFGVPNPFPPDQLETVVTWRDRHGNAVSENSAHKVSATVQLKEPSPRYNFDTVVRRQGASFTNLGDAALVDIEMTWLSLMSVSPIIATFDGVAPPERWDVYVGLSGTGLDGQGQQPVGRMHMLSKRFCAQPLAPCVLTELDMGQVGDPVDAQFSQDPTAFEFNPNALGLPALYEIHFVNAQDPQNPIFLGPIDNPFGLVQNVPHTAIVLHDENGGELLHVPEMVHGDVNWDFLVNNADIQPFINALLAGPGQPLSAQQREALAVLGFGVVPEPSSLGLLGLAAAAMLALRRRRSVN